MTMTDPTERHHIISDRIRTIRVLAILLVTVVHLQPALSEIDGAPALVEMTRFVVINIFGYAAVPILSIISGWLLVDTFAGKASYGVYVRGRFLTLYLPLVTWSCILALLLTLFHLAGLQTSLFRRLVEMPIHDALFALSDRPVNYPLYFLRDIFVLSLFAPVLLWLGRRAPFVLLGAALLMFIGNVGSPVLLRPLTLLFFAVGIVLGTTRCDLLALDRYRGHILLSSLAFWAGMLVYLLYVREADDLYDRVKYLDLVNRTLVALVFWIIADPMLRWVGRDRIVQMERRIYLVFLSHVVVIAVVGGAFGVVFGGYDTYAYLLLFAATPLYCYLAASAVFDLVRRLPSPLQIIVMGKSTSQTTTRAGRPIKPI